MHRSVLLPTLALSLTAVAGTLAAQDVLPAPDAVLAPLHINGGTVQRLPLPPSGGTSLRVGIVLDQRRTLDLQRYEVYGRDAALVHITGDGTVSLEKLPPSNTYRGTVSGLPGSMVAANLYRGQLTAYIASPAGNWSVEPATEAIATLPATAHVVYREEQVLPWNGTCESIAVDQPELRGTPLPGTSVPQRPLTAQVSATSAQFAGELTPNYINQVGGRTNAVNRVTTIVNAMGVIYANNTVLSSIRITALVARDGGYSGSASAKLSSMRSLWLARAQELLQSADVVQAFDSSLSGSTIGIAYISGACNNNRFSVVQNYGNATQRAALSAHEIGHSLSASHCSGGGCYIMCPTIGGCGRNLTRFGTAARNAINNFVSRRACFTN